MSRTVIHDPKHTSGVSIRGAPHDHIDEPTEWLNSIFGFTSAEDPHSVNIQGRQVSPGSESFVFVFNFHCQTRLSGQSGVFSETRLYARLLIGTDHEITFSQAASLPTSFVQVKNAAGLGSEVGVAGKDPAAMLPGSNSIFTEPTPDGGVADRCDKPGPSCPFGKDA